MVLCQYFVFRLKSLFFHIVIEFESLKIFMSKLSIYFHTLKYLKFTQVFHRILRKLRHPKIRYIEGHCAEKIGGWVTQELYQQKFIGESEVCFLNHIGDVKHKAGWNDNKEEKLWLYNLHYFDDLNSFDSNARRGLQSKWVNKWIEDNPASFGGNGWEAYTLSLRIVNWTKAFLSGLEHDQRMLNSLAQQADFLSQDLEKHLLGNHYFVNLKALIFAGCFLQGKEADAWLNIALKDFEKELNEQVLADGGSFELTPMYHAIMLTDLSDLANLFKAFPNRVPESLVLIVDQIIVKMFDWLNIMNLGDGKVSFFNDSAFGIAPENDTLKEYVTRLGFTVNQLIIPEDKLVVHNLHNSGYVSVKTSEICLIADLASVGPSYIPGHAHADSLSFELSLGDNRIFVNSGTSQYGMSPERLRQRGTAAHNTVIVNDKNSSEVWSGFRVAKRANIGCRNIGKVSSNQTVEFSGTHNGYKKQGINCIHHRHWQVTPNTCVIKDNLEGVYESAVGHLHLHPEIHIIEFNEKSCILRTEAYEIAIDLNGAHLSVENSSWHPEFGVILLSKKLKVQFLQPNVTHNICWKRI